MDVYMSKQDVIQHDRFAARAATRADIEFVAWCNIEASSPTPEFCYWDALVAHTSTPTREFVRELLTCDGLAWGRVEDFWLIERDGRPIAGGSGFEMDRRDFRPLRLDRLQIVAKGLGWSVGALKKFEALYAGVWPNPLDETLSPQAPWILECIAVASDARGEGVAGRLLEALLEEGRRRGQSHAGISVTTGNQPAQRAYEKHGFKLHIQYGADSFNDQYPGSTKYRIRL